MSARVAVAHGVAVAAALLACAAHAEAHLPDDDDKALPCRPTIACTADFVPPGTLEIEQGYLARNFGDGSWQQSEPLLVKLTLARWVQLQVATNGFVFTQGAPEPQRYVDDVGLGFKLHALDQQHRFPSLSFSAAVSVPLWAQPGYVRTWDLFFIAYATKDIGRLHADLNFGLNLWQLEDRAQVQAWVALALSVELPRHVTLMAEGYDFTDAAPLALRDAGLLGAVAWAPRPWVVLDVGGDVGLGVPRRGSVFVGMTIIPVRLWGKRKLLAGERVY